MTPSLAQKISVVLSTCVTICIPVVYADGPNVLLISLDTVRSDHCSVHGYSRETTPNLSALGRKGVVFQDAYAPSSSTAPSHMTMFTGKYPIEHGVVKNGLTDEPRFEMLAERFAANGYGTGAVISSYVLNRKFGFSKGFDDFRDEIPEGTGVIDLATWDGHELEHAFDRRANDTTNVALEWLREPARSEAPWFLFVHYFEPHHPFLPPAPYKERFAKGTTKGTTAYKIAQYDAGLRFTDAEIGRLLAIARRESMLDDTIVMVVADHGEGLMDHGEMHHGQDIYEESVRIPFIVYWPDLPEPGRRIEGPVELTDLMPTLLTLSGIGSSSAGPGRDLTRVLQGQESLNADRPVFLHRRHYAPGHSGEPWLGEKFAVVRGGWKYIAGVEENTWELYDLRNDPGERSNVIATYSERRDELARMLESWMKQYTRADAVVPALDPGVTEALEALGYIE